MVGFVLIATALLLGTVSAQDPATGWMAYAVGSVPDGTDRITDISMKWKVSENPRPSFAFFSPWFGMDPTDNLNLVQPVNPWSGYSWSMYTEYFQWSPEHNSNSRSYSVKAGDILHGRIQYDQSSDSYLISQTNTSNGDVSKQTVQAQSGKKYNLPYVVYEKTFGCSHYPPDEKVSFYDISVECDGKDCTNDVKWEAKIKDANCDMKAVINSPTSIDITWNTKGESPYEHMSQEKLMELNGKGWGAKFVPAPTHELKDGANCIDSIVALGGEVMELYNDVKSVLGGDLSGIMTLVNDFQTFVTNVKAAVTACGL